MPSSTAPPLGEDYRLSRKLPTASAEKAGIRPWNVVHACPQAREVLPLIDVQVAAGMKPFLVTPHGAGTPDLYLRGAEEAQSSSLLSAWADVRQWRRSLLEADPDQTAEIIHAHSFASGMAAVRNFSAVVYDMTGCVEELATAAGQCEAHSWIARSFRVAEQFILARAGAIVVHSSLVRESVLERGAPTENVFLVLLPEEWKDAPSALRTENLNPILAQRYDGIYQHAFANRKRSPAPPTNGSLIPLQA